MGQAFTLIALNSTIIQLLKEGVFERRLDDSALSPKLLQLGLQFVYLVLQFLDNDRQTAVNHRASQPANRGYCPGCREPPLLAGTKIRPARPAYPALALIRRLHVRQPFLLQEKLRAAGIEVAKLETKSRRV